MTGRHEPIQKNQTGSTVTPTLTITLLYQLHLHTIGLRRTAKVLLADRHTQKIWQKINNWKIRKCSLNWHISQFGLHVNIVEFRIKAHDWGRYCDQHGVLSCWLKRMLQNIIAKYFITKFLTPWPKRKVTMGHEIVRQFKTVLSGLHNDVFSTVSSWCDAHAAVRLCHRPLFFVIFLYLDLPMTSPWPPYERQQRQAF